MPNGYEERYTDDGDAEFVNLKTGEISYDHPLDDIYRKKVVDERKKLTFAKPFKAELK